MHALQLFVGLTSLISVDQLASKRVKPVRRHTVQHVQYGVRLSLLAVRTGHWCRGVESYSGARRRATPAESWQGLAGDWLSGPFALRTYNVEAAHPNRKIRGHSQCGSMLFSGRVLPLWWP